MSMFKGALAVAFVFIGSIAALLGLVVLVSALKTGAIILSYGAAAPETVSQATDPNRFWTLFAGLGVLPLVLGGLAARWGLTTLKQ